MDALGWVQAIAGVSTVGIAAWAAMQSKKSASKSAEAAEASLDMTAIRNFAYLRPVNHHWFHDRKSKQPLVVAIELRNEGGESAILEEAWLELPDKLRANSVVYGKVNLVDSKQNDRRWEITLGNSGSPVVIPAAARTWVGMKWGYHPELGERYRIKMRSANSPPVDLGFSPSERGGAGWSQRNVGNPAKEIRRWLEESSEDWDWVRL